MKQKKNLHINSLVFSVVLLRINQAVDTCLQAACSNS